MGGCESFSRIAHLIITCKMIYYGEMMFKITQEAKKAFNTLLTSGDIKEPVFRVLILGFG